MVLVRLCGARGQSRCAGALLGTWMGDTGGKSGRRPARHLQVEPSASCQISHDRRPRARQANESMDGLGARLLVSQVSGHWCAELKPAVLANKGLGPARRPSRAEIHLQRDSRCRGLARRASHGAACSRGRRRRRARHLRTAHPCLARQHTPTDTGGVISPPCEALPRASSAALA